MTAPTQSRDERTHADTHAPSEWLTAQDAAALTGVSPATLRRWSDAGDVPTYTTPGGHRRFRRAAILALVGVETHPRQRGARQDTRSADVTTPKVAAGTLVAVVAHARRVPTAAREAYAQALAAIAEHPAVTVIHTCQRVEVYVAAAESCGLTLPAPPAGALQLADVDAARHLISVACGLESAVLGEDQVLHQMREAHSTRQSAGPLAPVVDRLFQVALHAGRRARSTLGPVRRSLADVALDVIAERVGDLAGRTVVVVGAGRMGTLAAVAAHRRGADVVVTNRSAAHAQALADDVHGATCAWDLGDLPTSAPVAGVVVALSGAWTVHPAAAARLHGDGSVVVDLSSPISTPQDVQAALADRFRCIDDLAADGRAQLPAELQDELEALVSESGRDYCRWLRSRAAQPTIAHLTEAVEARRVSEIEWLLHRLPDLDDHDRAMVEQMSQRLVAGILHSPRKALSTDDSGSLQRAAHELFGL